MKLIIAGSRCFTDELMVREVIDTELRRLGWIDQVDEVVSGDAQGPDRIGAAWAYENGIPVTIMAADWSIGKAAGIMRNRDMGLYGTHLLAIHDGSSSGTSHMIEFMRDKLKKPTQVWTPPQKKLHLVQPMSKSPQQLGLFARFGT